MNYEELYASVSLLQKEMKDSLASAARLQKACEKALDCGNLTELGKILEQLAKGAESLSDQVDKASRQVSDFDTREYFASGDFTQQLLSACQERGIDVKGEKGVYEMFPFKVRIYGDEERSEELWINRKKLNTYRPSFAADTIKAGQDRLYKEKFNETIFMGELLDVYQLVCSAEQQELDKPVSINKIYKALTPMARARRDYDINAFAFDLARIYELGEEKWVTKDGRRFTFGYSRDNSGGLRVLSRGGIENYIATLRQTSSGKEET